MKPCAKRLVTTTNMRSSEEGKSIAWLLRSIDIKADPISVHRKGDVPDLTADPTLAEKELGFTAPQDLETMCRDLWNWQIQHPNGYDELAVKPSTERPSVAKKLDTPDVKSGLNGSSVTIPTVA